MSDQNCIYCGEPVNYSSEPEFGETGDETPNGPAHYRCIAQARIEELENMVEAMRRAAKKAVNMSKEETNICGFCSWGGGSHGEDCPMNPVIDIAMMPVDWNIHGPQYLEENGGNSDD